MVFDLKLYERRYVLCGAQQKLVTEHWELPKDKSKTIYPPYRLSKISRRGEGDGTSGVAKADAG